MLALAGMMVVFRRPAQEQLFEHEPFSTNQIPICWPHKHVAFVKVHKAGSTTILNLMYRFALRRNLTIALPKGTNYINKYGTVHRSLLMPSHTQKYDLLCNHVVYNKRAFNVVMYHDTITFAIIRDPFEQFFSAFQFYHLLYKVGYLENIKGIGAVTQYLVNPKLYEPKIPGQCYTDNRMSFDLGLEPRYNRDPILIHRFVRDLDKDLGLVMLMEHMDESMVLLKRLLCWDTKDIILMKQNAMKYEHGLLKNGRQKMLHRKWAQADYILYDYFSTKFWARIHEQGLDFHEEVKAYASIRRDVVEFCEMKKPLETQINETKWSDSFIFTDEDCQHLKREEIQFTEYMKARS